MAVQELRLVRRLTQLAKNSPWLVIALGLHVILAAALSVVYLQQERRATAPTPTLIAVAPARAQPVVLPPQPELMRTKIPEQVVTELVPIEREMVFVPLEEPEEPLDFSAEVGDPTGSEDGGNFASTNIGVGSGGGQRADAVSSIFGKRPGGNGNPRGFGRQPDHQPVGTEEAVLEGLRWLMRHQNVDGSWGADTLTQHCDPRRPCISPEDELDSSYNVGMTSLALLAFLGQGISINSKTLIADPVRGERHKAGDIVKRGVKWLLERQKSDGSFSDSAPFEFPENETLATMVLCEAQALSRVRELRKPAQRAIDFLVAAQKRTVADLPWGFGLGSWRDLEQRHERGELDSEAFLEARASVDLSITCWVVMALKSAETCGFHVPEQTFRGPLDYCTAATGDDAATRFTIRSAAEEQDGLQAQAARVSALGMLIRSFVAQDITDPYLAHSAEVIAADVPKIGKGDSAVDFYYWYFATLALNQFDGPDSPRPGAGAYWSSWDEGLTRSLLPLQERDTMPKACSRGGWLQETRGNQKGRALYNTAMNVLTLEVYYRYANVFGSTLRRGK